MLNMNSNTNINHNHNPSFVEIATTGICGWQFRSIYRLCPQNF